MFIKYFLGIGTILLFSLIYKPSSPHLEIRSWVIESTEKPIEARFQKKEGPWVFLLDKQSKIQRISFFQFQVSDQNYIKETWAKWKTSSTRDISKASKFTREIPIALYSWFWGLLLLGSVVALSYSFYQNLNAWLSLSLSSLSILALLIISISQTRSHQPGFLNSEISQETPEVPSKGLNAIPGNELASETASQP